MVELVLMELITSRVPVLRHFLDIHVKVSHPPDFVSVLLIKGRLHRLTESTPSHWSAVHFENVTSTTKIYAKVVFYVGYAELALELTENKPNFKVINCKRVTLN